MRSCCASISHRGRHDCIAASPFTFPLSWRVTQSRGGNTRSRAALGGCRSASVLFRGLAPPPPPPSGTPPPSGGGGGGGKKGQAVSKSVARPIRRRPRPDGERVGVRRPRNQQLGLSLVCMG